VRRVRMMGLCLAALLALAAFAASSASAGLPEFGKCEAKAGGKYKNSNCTETAKKGEGSYEWKKGSQLKPRSFWGQNIGSGGVLTTYGRGCYKTVSGGKEEIGRRSRAKCKAEGNSEENEEGGTRFGPLTIECTSERNTGEIVGSKELKNITVVFHGCKFEGLACSNTSVEGEIDVNPLKGTLGYINKSEKKAGVLLEPGKKDGTFASFDCGGLLNTVVGVGNSTEGAFYEPEKTGGYDGIISPVTPVNQMTAHSKQVFTINPETAENLPSKFEGKHIDLLEDYLYNPNEEPEKNSTDWSPAGEEITNENTVCAHEVSTTEASGCSEGKLEEGEIKA
jgi:hypothetical protein